MIAKVTKVKHVRDYVLELQFNDGSQGQLDFRSWIVGREGLFEALEDVEMFKQVRLDAEAGTIAWPNGIDFCPDVLRHHATGAPLPGCEDRDESRSASSGAAPRTS
jgi:hypothetical protein